MDIKEKLLDYNLTEETYEELLNDIDKMKNGLMEKDWQSLIDKYDLPLNKDSLRKSMDCLGGYLATQYWKEKFANKSSIDSEEFLKELEMKRRELEKEKIKFQDERRTYNKYLRYDARFERLLDLLKQELSNIEPLNFIDDSYDYGNSQLEASLLISDTHLYMTADNYWNKYDIDIAKERLNQLVNKTITDCKLYNVKTLNVNLLGDLISGIIHSEIQIENQENIVRQVIGASEILAEVINTLGNKIPKVIVRMTCGNHGRVNPNKKDAVEKENFEYFIWEFLKLRVVNEKVTFEENDIDDTIIHYEVNGKHICGVHGHLDKVNSIANDFSKMFDFKPSLIVCGHLHHEYSNNENGITVLMNNTMSGVDTYAKNGRYIGKPSQTLIIHKDEDEIIHNMRFTI